MAEHLPTASYSFIMRVRIESKPGSFAKVASAIGDAGGDLGAIDLVRSGRTATVRDITVSARDSDHAKSIVKSVKEVAEVEQVSDRTFLTHLGGKIEMKSRVRVENRDDLSMIYTPGVARVCMSIYDDVDRSWNLTSRGHTVLILTDGSRVLGLGNIGPEAAMPVMEGKAILFKEFGGVDAWPLCVATQDTEEIIKLAKQLAPNFGAINLEDIESPRCFEIERRLQEELDIPVFHDDQHGTACAALAGLLNALRVVGKDLADVKIVCVGAGAAGGATARLIHHAGAKNIVIFDSSGPIHRDRENLDSHLEWFALNTNPDQYTGDLPGALDGADVVIGLAAPNIIKPEWAAKMNNDAIIFALSNPDPEIRPEDIPANIAVMATGRSDYPNQINNALIFPGVFKGAMGVHAKEINEEMKVAAARALAAVIPDEKLNAEYIIPSVFNPQVSSDIAKAVAKAAGQTGASRKLRSEDYGALNDDI